MKFKFLFVFICILLSENSSDAQSVKIGTQGNNHKVIVREFIDTLITKDPVNGDEGIMIIKSSGLYLKLADCQRLTGIFDLGATQTDVSILRNLSNIQIYCIPKQEPLEWTIVHLQVSLERNGFEPQIFEESEFQFSDVLQNELAKLNAGDRMIVNKLQLTGSGGRTSMFSFSVIGD